MAYKLLAVEGSGAYGTVVKARDLGRGRKIVALKVLRQDHLDNPRVLCRTRDEARMLTALDHPNIVKVYDLDERYGRPVMVMEWLEAYSLGDLIDHIGTGFLRGVSGGALREDGNAGIFARAVGHDGSATHDLVGFTRIDAQIDGNVERFFELDGGQLAEQSHGFI